MAKSKSQRMKEYRARKKEQLGEKWMKLERERTKSYYKPIDMLSDEDKIKRRERNRQNAKSFYDKHKKNTNADSHLSVENNEENATHELIEPQPGSSHEEETCVSSTTEDRNLIVKLPISSWTSKRKGPQRRQSRAIKRSYKRIETLEEKNEELKRKLKNAQKRLQRHQSSIKKPALTPKSKTDALLKDAGLNPKEVPSIRKQLLYAECVNQEIRDSVKSKDKTGIHKIVSGQIIKKYRMRTHLQKMTMLDRRSRPAACNQRKQKLRTKAEKIKTDVQTFLNRDDNSRVLPGKNDAVKVGSLKKQKRILNDYMHNLHLKFVSESDYKVSRASFCRLRPKELSLVNFTSRSVCLCSKHQNFSFKLRCLKTMGLSTCTSPDTFVDIYKNSQVQFDNVLENISHEKVKFQQWKRVKLQSEKERMRIVEIEILRDEFIQTMKKEFSEFVGHVDRVTKQYKSVKSMKENLPKNHVLVQMDFSENYNCQTMEEIQSAYWNSSMVTLHPTIVYFNQEDGNLGHKSMVFVSEVLHHNASMVLAIIKKTVTSIKSLVPDVKFIHFWTDSPSSQYRNKSIFNLIEKFESLYGCKATWQYFESGHGKSACDGVGGTAKRNADMAVKQSKAVIQDANGFFAWAVSSQTEIEYQMITQEEYEQSNQEIEQKKNEIKPLKGTMSVHAVASDGSGSLLVRATTCVCESCFGENGFSRDSACKWDKVTLNYAEPHSNIRKEAAEKVQISDYIVAVYEGKCYIGQVLEIDTQDDTMNVNFMVESGKALKRYRWPSKEDKLWIKKEDILRIIDAPVPTGKCGRMFAIPDEVINFMELKTNK